MATKKSHQPLLYIHQPTFENKSPSMQQFFITKRTKQNNVVETNYKDKFIEDEVKADLKENVSTKTLGQHLELELAHKIDLVFLEESQETNVMEFMLEGILTQGVEPEMEAEDPSIINLNMIEDKMLDSSANLKENKVVVEESIISHEINNEKRKKRTSFNEKSIDNKIKLLRKMPAMVVKFLFEFVTEEKSYKGYFHLLEDNRFKIQTPESSEFINIEVNNIIDIKMIGI
jgi:hypothetical protein